MNGQRSHDRQGIDDLLHEIVRVARAGREFFVAAYPGIEDAQVRTTFACVSDVRQRLIAELEQWMPAANAGPGPAARAAAIEQMYAEARGACRGRPPAGAVHALHAGEDLLLRLVERACADARLPALRGVLKTYYAQLLSCRQAIWRLHGSRAA